MTFQVKLLVILVWQNEQKNGGYCTFNPKGFHEVAHIH
jgi:hypothetical protein